MNRLLSSGLGCGCLLAAGALMTLRERPAGPTPEERSEGRRTRSVAANTEPIPPGRGPARTRASTEDRSLATRIKRGNVHVAGHVREPGAVRAAGMTVAAAIEKAGGADEFGATNRILITRAGEILTCNLKSDAGRQMLVTENDTIEVPEKILWGQ